MTMKTIKEEIIDLLGKCVERGINVQFVGREHSENFVAVHVYESIIIIDLRHPEEDIYPMLKEYVDGLYEPSEWIRDEYTKLREGKK